MENLTRVLQVFVDGEEVAQGCRIILTARQTLALQPQLHRLEIYDLSDSSEAKITAVQTADSSAVRASAARIVEVRSGSTILASGELVEACTRSASGRRITSIVFSPGYALWQASVSLSLVAGMKVSETIRAILNAAGASGITGTAGTSGTSVASGISGTSGNSGSSGASGASGTSGAPVRLASYLAPDPTFLRSQAFFGRTCDALSLLAETAGAQAFLSPAGLCILSDSAQIQIISLSEEELLSPPYVSGSHLLVQTRMRDWLPGTDVQLSWKNLSYRGRVVNSLIQADNASGPWKSELELRLSD